jgi:hypothetical protein
MEREAHKEAFVIPRRNRKCNQCDVAEVHAEAPGNVSGVDVAETTKLSAFLPRPPR